MSMQEQEQTTELLSEQMFYLVELVILIADLEQQVSLQQTIQ
jgi:hypothetical protein